MAHLFEVRDKRVFPNTETLLIEPFKTIWNRDKSKDKVIAIEEFSYIEFISSSLATNPYKGYSPDDRKKRLYKDIITREGWIPDELINIGITMIDDFQKKGSKTYAFYISARTGLEKLQDFFLDFNMNDTNEKGQLLYKPKDITNALNDVGKIIQSYDILEKKVEEELYTDSKNKADKQISYFADTESLN